MVDLWICDDEYVCWFFFEIKWWNCSWLKKGGGRKKLVLVSYRYLLILGFLVKKKKLILGGLIKRILILIGGIIKKIY